VLPARILEKHVAWGRKGGRTREDIDSRCGQQIVLHRTLWDFTAAPDEQRAVGRVGHGRLRAVQGANLSTDGQNTRRRKMPQRMWSNARWLQRIRELLRSVTFL